MTHCFYSIRYSQVKMLSAIDGLGEQDKAAIGRLWDGRGTEDDLELAARLDLLPFDEEPLKRTFSTKQAAEQWAREHFGSSPRDREGWRVERDSVRYVGERQVPQLFHSTD